MVDNNKEEGQASLLDNIYQDNNSDIYVTQKNIVILYFEGDEGNYPNLEPLEEITDEELNMKVNEEGNIQLNDQEVEVTEVADGSIIFAVESEEIKTE